MTRLANVLGRLVVVHAAALSALALIGHAVLSSAERQAASGARAMFYGPDSGEVTGAKTTPAEVRRVAPAAAPRFIGVHYWIELLDRGAVTDQTKFTTGDRIRLHVRTNVNGFLAVWALDNERHAQLLLPATGIAGGSPMEAGSDYSSPVITFAPPVQDERLVLFLGRKRAEMPSATAVELGFRALLTNEDARNLKVEVVETIAGQVGTYVVNEQGGPVAHDILLRHVSK